MPDNIITEFPVSIYGNLQRYNETISKARCRIFYKGLNRNGTYITDEFAEKLLASIAYAPVKGIYSGDDDDYTDHGTKRSLGRIYGIVPENPNVQWEVHPDEDGIDRTYACVDVFIYTALYVEASQIVGKSQSMELYPKTLKGNYQIKDGKRCFVFEDGCFLGLQVLGDDVEPCFEGAAFYSLYSKDMFSEMQKMVAQFEKFNLISQNGGKRMLNYKLSDGAKFNALWSLLNVNYNEAGDWRVDFDICEVYDKYAVVKNYAEGIWERISYTKDDNSDSVEITGRERCYIMDVSESEKKALETLHHLNGDTYEKVDENFTTASEEAGKVAGLNEQINSLNGQVEKFTADQENFEFKIGELTTTVSTLTTERDNVTAQFTEAQGTIETLTAENEALSSYKADIERKEKKDIIAKYSAKLSAETLQPFTDSLDNYSAIELDKELAYTLVTADATIFSKEGQPEMLPKDNPQVGGIESILNKYKK